MISNLSNKVLYDLIRDHWREIKGISQELERRKKRKSTNEGVDLETA